ncbi:hypothetical protein C8P68_105200 [Mucilaginibacter yixingensis]|uniref:Uncharacterized protein n=1 Tax=Mucilaginibacter yixingensis TaxID=1295612 RepID=A0A2T5J8A5_9SPHI|nr:hypothetical protein [Mucilaginibacter yixingensis]PTQ95693.1 hypothetical protein C8P68_105200 [Mucilaginibacter yixingensis]
MDYQIFIYSVRVWLSAVFLSPVLVLIPDGQLFKMTLSDWSIYLSVVLLSIFFSIPCFLSLWLAVNLVQFSSWHIMLKKLSLCIIGVAFTILPFFVLLGSEATFNDSSSPVLAYVLVICAGIWFYRLTPR